MLNISMLSGITKGRTISCCSLGVQTSAATSMFNAASEWAGSCTITTAKRRERGGESPDGIFDHTRLLPCRPRAPSKGGDHGQRSLIARHASTTSADRNQ